MLLIVGPEAGRTCEDWQIADLENPCPRPWLEDTVEPRVYWPAALWPEVAALCAFDSERTRLGLPTLSDSVFQ